MPQRSWSPAPWVGWTKCRGFRATCWMTPRQEILWLDLWPLTRSSFMLRITCAE